MGKSRAGRRPQSESSVDVRPSARVASRRANLSRRIEGFCVYIARLNANDGCGGKIGQRICAHTPLIVNGHALDTRSPETEKREGLENARMNFIADHNVDRRSADQAALFDVPARLKQHGPPSRCESGE